MNSRYYHLSKSPVFKSLKVVDHPERVKASAPPPCPGDDAIGTDGVTAILNLEQGAGASKRPLDVGFPHLPLLLDIAYNDHWVRATGGISQEIRNGGFFRVSQDRPNPFNAATEIQYALPRDCYVRLEIFNVEGRHVVSLVDGEQRAGYNAVAWDASSFSSGVYFCRFRSGDFVETRRMVVIK